jgi:hypothetical protein
MKQTAVDFIVTKFNHLTWLRRRGEISEVTEYERQAKFFFEAKEMEKEQACDFADYVINRAKDFEDGLIDHREYEGSIDEMFERRYRDGGAELSTEEKQYWEDVDKLRKEREEKYK